MNGPSSKLLVAHRSSHMLCLFASTDDHENGVVAGVHAWSCSRMWHCHPLHWSCGVGFQHVDTLNPILCCDWLISQLKILLTGQIEQEPENSVAVSRPRVKVSHGIIFLLKNPENSLNNKKRFCGRLANCPLARSTCTFPVVIGASARESGWLVPVLAWSVAIPAVREPLNIFSGAVRHSIFHPLEPANLRTEELSGYGFARISPCNSA
jgi:hypothetical protein